MKSWIGLSLPILTVLTPPGGGDSDSSQAASALLGLLPSWFWEGPPHTAPRLQRAPCWFCLQMVFQDDSSQEELRNPKRPKHFWRSKINSVPYLHICPFDHYVAIRNGDVPEQPECTIQQCSHGTLEALGVWLEWLISWILTVFSFAQLKFKYTVGLSGFSEAQHSSRTFYREVLSFTGPNCFGCKFHEDHSLARHAHGPCLGGSQQVSKE